MVGRVYRDEGVLGNVVGGYRVYMDERVVGSVGGGLVGFTGMREL